MNEMYQKTPSSFADKTAIPIIATNKHKLIKLKVKNAHNVDEK